MRSIEANIDAIKQKDAERKLQVALVWFFIAIFSMGAIVL
jgi:hypothetical protein